MPELVGVDLARVERRIRSCLSAYPEVAGAFLFGSALDLCRPDSDIDLGIVRNGPLDRGDLWADLGLAEELSAELGTFDGHPFHVTVLSLRAPFLAFEAVHTGRLVQVGNDDVVTDFIEEVALRQLRDYPRYRTALREVNS